jgi:hypothetical protein
MSLRTLLLRAHAIKHILAQGHRLPLVFAKGATQAAQPQAVRTRKGSLGELPLDPHGEEPPNLCEARLASPEPADGAPRRRRKPAVIISLRATR